MRQEVTIDEAIAYLNDLLEAGGYTVGMLGVINGLFGVDEDGRGPIAYTAGPGEGVTGFLRAPQGRPWLEEGPEIEFEIEELTREECIQRAQEAREEMVSLLYLAGADEVAASFEKGPWVNDV